MRAYRGIKKVFSNLNQTCREWHPKSQFPRSRMTAQVILFGDEPVEPVAVAYMAHCLGFDNKKVVDLLDQYVAERPEKAGEIKILRKLIAPVELTADEQTMIERMRKLPANKRQVFMEMLSTMES
jgi:hypothetical protein